MKKKAKASVLGRGLSPPSVPRALGPATQLACKVVAPAPAAPVADAGREARKYPRAELQVAARLSIAGDKTRYFEATLPTFNLSVGGLFLASTFFLKLGTLLDVELKLPPHGRKVRARGQVVRVETIDRGGTGHTGFALRFTEYLDGSQVILATHFLAPVLREFIQQYAKEQRLKASPEYVAHTADVLAAWELRKAELGGDVWDLQSTR